MSGSSSESDSPASTKPPSSNNGSGLNPPFVGSESTSLVSVSSTEEGNPQPSYEGHFQKIPKAKTIALAIVVGSAYMVWGALISLQPPFYPTEAEKKGATPSQVRAFNLPF